uniref:Glucosidase alpha, neutral C n=1 Tax=Leptobrachium leishanense TaxID=445787 RepID=A0A8C5MPJ9_9ANUR
GGRGKWQTPRSRDHPPEDLAFSAPLRNRHLTSLVGDGPAETPGRKAYEHQLLSLSPVSRPLKLNLAPSYLSSPSPARVSPRGEKMKASCESGAWGSLGRAWNHMSWLYYQYLLVTALYMLEPWERTIFNSMLISIMGMALYTGYIFMPQHILAILHYFEIVQ